MKAPGEHQHAFPFTEEPTCEPWVTVISVSTKTKPWILVRRNTFFFKDKYLTYCLKWSPGYIFYLISKSIQNCTNWPICLDQITSMLQDLMSHFSIKATTGSVHWEGLIWEDERHFVLLKVWTELNEEVRAYGMVQYETTPFSFHLYLVLFISAERAVWLSCERHTGMASPGSQEKKMLRWPKQTPAESFQIFSLILHLPVLLTLVQTRATKAGRLED